MLSTEPALGARTKSIRYRREKADGGRWEHVNEVTRHECTWLMGLATVRPGIWKQDLRLDGTEEQDRRQESKFEWYFMSLGQKSRGSDDEKEETAYFCYLLWQKGFLQT